METFDLEQTDPHLRVALTAYLDLLDSAFPKEEISVYLVGSIALDDYQTRKSDIDFIALRKRPWQSGALDLLGKLHVKFAKQSSFPKLDGIYITHQDLERPPEKCSPPFVLENKFRSSGGFAANPITWKYLQGQALVLRGPANLSVAIDDTTVRAWCVSNVGTYWTRWLHRLKHEFPYNVLGLGKATTEWGVLGLSRIFATISSNRILSKSEAAQFARRNLEKKWHPIVDGAFEIRGGKNGVPLGPFKRRALTIEYVESMIRVILRSAPPLRGQDLYLRTMQPADYPTIVDLCFYDGEAAQNEADAIEIGRKIQKDCDEGNSIHWAVCRSEDGHILGNIGFYRGFENQTGEIGYVLREEFRRKGYGSQAIRCACEYGFSTLKLKQIVAYTGSDNLGSRKALEANDFRVESENESEVTYVLKNKS